MSAKKIREWAWPYIKNFRTYIDVGALDGDTAKPFVNNFEKIIAFGMTGSGSSCFGIFKNSEDLTVFFKLFALTLILFSKKLNGNPK